MTESHPVEEKTGIFYPEPHTEGIDNTRKRRPPQNLPDAMLKAREATE